MAAIPVVHEETSAGITGVDAKNVTSRAMPAAPAIPGAMSSTLIEYRAA